MKLATLTDGSRDGQLVVVSRDLSLAVHAAAIATRLQTVLERVLDAVSAPVSRAVSGVP